MFQTPPRRPARLLWILLSLLFWAAPPGAPAEARPDEGEQGDGAEEGDGAEQGADASGEATSPETSPLKVPDDAEAKKLAVALGKAARKKNANDVLPAMEAIAELDHADFHKVLLKLLQHESSLVAVRAAEMWEWRVHEPKVADKLWKACYQDKSNKRRYLVKAIALKAFARAQQVLDARQFKEIERDWRWIHGNPIKINAPALIALTEYFKIMKDKRMCKAFAEALDDPCANVNAADPATMPVDWQEKRWWIWNEAKPAVVAALAAITGQTFDKTEAAKAWFQANEKTFGVSW